MCHKSNCSVLQLVLWAAPVDQVKTDACIHSHRTMLLPTKDKVMAPPWRPWADQVVVCHADDYLVSI